MSNSEVQQPRRSSEHKSDVQISVRKSFPGTGTASSAIELSGLTAPARKSSVRRSGHYTSTEDEDESYKARNSPSSNHGISFSIAGPVQAPEGDWSLIADAEAARRSATINVNRANGADDSVAVEITGGVHGGLSAPLPIILKFEDLKYKVLVTPKASWGFESKKTGDAGEITEKEILHGLSGSVAPGEVLALLGPSGCGKTTLLNVLGGRMSRANISGSITYNGLPYNKSLKRRMGFVTQDDILYPHLTVKETLTYAALLRLPKSLTRQQKVARAEEILVELGLERCRDTIIGGPFLRGISGGERKRVCIGHEILIDPSIIFLDEPTSGLDSTIALRIVQLIQSIAQGGRTVVASIHQPASRLFYMFSKVLLLSEGNTVYYGKASGAMDYFESIGFAPSVAMNPADFLLDLANGNLDAISVPSALENRAATDQSAKSGTPAGKPTQKEVHQYLVEKFNSQAALPENKKLIEFAPGDNGSQEAVLKQEWNTTFHEQFYVLLVRGLSERRHEYLSWLRIIQVVAISIIIGLLWWQSKSDTENKLSDQVGLIFFISIFWGFFPLFTAIFTFPLERAILAKERASAMYRLSAYFLSRTLGDVPMDMLLLFLFIIIVYFMTHLHMSAKAFFLTTLALILNTVAAQGVGLFVGAAMMDVQKATTMASIMMLTFMLTGGFYVEHIPVFIKWLKYLSFPYHTFKLLLKIQYSNNETYSCSDPQGCSIATSPAIRHVRLGGGGSEIIALFAMVVGYRILAYMALRRMKTRV